MVSIFSLLSEYPTDKVEPETAPRLVVGAASPLWLMFGGAAAAGAAYWWWASRWREAVNLEALMALAPEPVAPPLEALATLEAQPAPVVEAVEAMAEVAETVIDAVEEVAVATAEPLVEVVVAANEDVAELVVETVAEPIAQAEPAVIEAVEAVAEAPVEVVADAAPVVEAVAETVKAAGDDLTRLVGVGPKLAASLADLGVTTFSQIAAWTPDELASFDELLNLKGRADRDAWIAQAKRFAAPVEA